MFGKDNGAVSVILQCPQCTRECQMPRDKYILNPRVACDRCGAEMKISGAVAGRVEPCETWRDRPASPKRAEATTLDEGQISISAFQEPFALS